MITDLLLLGTSSLQKVTNMALTVHTCRIDVLASPVSDESETLIALDLRAGEANLGLGRRPESWEWSGWVQTARTIHLDRF